MTEICYNSARAVTNNPEMLANKLKDRYGLNTRTLIWIERYSKQCRSTEKGKWLDESFDLVKFKNGGAGRFRVELISQIAGGRDRYPHRGSKWILGAVLRK